MKIFKKRCKNCLFTNNKIVSDERKAELLAEIKKDSSYFICHVASMEGEDIACRGFINKHGQDSKLYSFAKFIGAVEELELPKKDLELLPYKNIPK